MGKKKKCMYSTIHFDTLTPDSNMTYFQVNMYTPQQLEMLTCPPLASMLTHIVLVGREEFSKQDRHSPVYAYLESFLANTYTVFVAIFS